MLWRYGKLLHHYCVDIAAKMITEYLNSIYAQIENCELISTLKKYNSTQDRNPTDIGL